MLLNNKTPLTVIICEIKTDIMHWLISLANKCHYSSPMTLVLRYDYMARPLTLYIIIRLLCLGETHSDVNAGSQSPNLVNLVPDWALDYSYFRNSGVTREFSGLHGRSNNSDNSGKIYWKL